MSQKTVKCFPGSINSHIGRASIIEGKHSVWSIGGEIKHDLLVTASNEN
jgi:hypothetical protein